MIQKKKEDNGLNRFLFQNYRKSKGNKTPITLFFHLVDY